MKCLIVLPMLFIAVFARASTDDHDNGMKRTVRHTRPGHDDDGIVDQVFSLCDTNFDAKLSLDEAKDCEDQYCDSFGITNCPDQDELEVADHDRDGFLTPEELYNMAIGLHVTNPA